MDHIALALNKLIICAKSGEANLFRKENQDNEDGNKDSSSRPRLTLDEINLIARILISRGHYGTCAALNVVSKGVWAHTIPILWMTFVLWGADVYNQLSACGDGLDGMSDRTTEIAREASRKWKIHQECVGMLFIQYVVLPSFEMSEDQAPSSRDGAPPGARFPVHDLKATIRIRAIPNFDALAGPMTQSVIVNLDTKYRPGTNDVYGLFQTLSLFYKIGNQQIKHIFHGPNAITIMPDTPELQKARSPEKQAPEPLPSIKDALAQLAPLRHRSHGNLPSAINISSANSLSPETMSLVFLEALHWMKIERGRSHNGTIHIIDERPEVILACVRAYQKAVKAEPAFASLWCRFTIYCDIPLVLLMPELNKVIAIVRGTYLVTRPHLSLDEVGVCNLTAFSPSGKLAWAIAAERHDDRIATMFWAKGAPVNTVHDSWGNKA